MSDDNFGSDTAYAEDTATEDMVITVRAWTVVLHNDDITPMDVVTFLLQQVFHIGIETANTVTMKVHNEGKCAIGTFTRDVAETKASQMVEGALKIGGYPLRAEAAPVE
jgi:ATP-dependent Clp protease adaptor protein ClpS